MNTRDYTIKNLEAEITSLKSDLVNYKEAFEKQEKKARVAWRRYFLVKCNSIPKPCPWCDGLIIERVNRHGGYYAACSNYLTNDCNYYVKEKKDKKSILNAYELSP
jgi:hypothetical protein